ncbi:MAG: hypothetical protein QW566_00470 [Candidatus Jordarchaeales archaeon]
MKKLDKHSFDKPMIITFAGTVGSGKSTQMKLLASNLDAKEFRVETTFLKSGHLLAYLLEVFLAKLCTGERGKISPIRALIEKRAALLRRLFKLWLILDMLSVLTRFLLRVYLPAKAGHIVLVEEYLPATIADYFYISKALGSSAKEISCTLNFMCRLLHLGGPILTVFLDAPDSILEDRWNKRGSPREYFDYLQMQHTLLFSLYKRFSHCFLYVNTSNGTIDEIHEEIAMLCRGSLGLK